jgi:uncharacterized protein YcfJ
MEDLSMTIRLPAAAVVAVTLAFGAGLSGQAMAKGCIKGAVVGGVGGHMLGHHGGAGAAAGCAVGHHEASKKTKADAANPPS